MSNYLKDMVVAFELYESIRLENQRLQKRIDELKSGACRFNCASMKEAFIAGYEFGAEDMLADWYCPNTAYKSWMKERSE